MLDRGCTTWYNVDITNEGKLLMGYHTEFSGALAPTTELTANQIFHFKKVLGEDLRDHPD